MPRLTVVVVSSVATGISIIVCFLQDRVVGPVANPQPGGPGDHFLSDPYPLNCPARMTGI